MKLLSMLAATMLAAGSAQAVEVSATSALPFAYSIDSVEESQMNGYSFTVVTVTVTNGPRFLREATISCEAESAEGYTWDVIGRFSVLDENATRVVRFSSEGETHADFTNPATLDCEVTSFSVNFV